MTHEDLDAVSIQRICCGDPEAAQWLQVGRVYCHAIDDLIDEDIPNSHRIRGAERVCVIGALALEVYTHPFFIKHSAALKQAMLTCTNTYADSVRWEHSPVTWQMQYADWARHAWIQVVLTVAGLCGGYTHMRALSEELWAISYADHHNTAGAAT